MFKSHSSTSRNSKIWATVFESLISMTTSIAKTCKSSLKGLCLTFRLNIFTSTKLLLPGLIIKLIIRFIHMNSEHL